MAEIVPSSIALWRPFSGKGTTLLTHDIVCVHTMVGSLAGSWNYANGAGRAYWHFGTSGLGECWQCQDLRFRSAANLNGNHRVIPIENADMGPGFGPWNGQCGHVPAFTHAQVLKLIDLIEWLCRRYNIPPVLIPDTKPGRRGIAYHRQGVNPWRCATCELWSTATGKCCPDGARIDQLVNIIIPAVAARINKQPPLPVQEEDMKPMLIRRPRDGAYFLYVDGVKQYQNNLQAVGENLWNYAAAGNPIQCQPGGVPFDWLDWQVDRIPPQLPTVEGFQGDDWNDPPELRRARGHLNTELVDGLNTVYSTPRFLEGIHQHAYSADVDADTNAAKLAEIDAEVDHITDMMHEDGTPEEPPPDEPPTPQ
jgi:hypothetical protein